MAGIHGKNMELWGAGYNLTQFFNNVTMSGEREIAQDTNPTDTAHRYKGGLSSGAISAQGKFSDGSGESVRLLEPLLTVNTSVFCLLPNGSAAAGEDMLAMRTSVTQLDINSPLDDLVELSFEGESITGLDIGRLLSPNVSATAAETGATVDDGAATANGGAAYLQVLSFTGTNIDIAVQDSSDGSTGWADIVTMNYVGTASNVQERKELAEGSAVKRYLHAEVSGTFSECTFILGFCRYAG